MFNFKSDETKNIYKLKTTQDSINISSKSIGYPPCLDLKVKNSSFCQHVKVEKVNDSNTLKMKSFNYFLSENKVLNQMQITQRSALSNCGQMLNLNDINLKLEFRDNFISYLKFNNSFISKKLKKKIMYSEKNLQFTQSKSNCGVRIYSLNGRVSMKSFKVGVSNIRENLSPSLMNLSKDWKFISSTVLKKKYVNVDKSTTKALEKHEKELAKHKQKFNLCNHFFKDCLDDEIFKMNKMFLNIFDNDLLNNVSCYTSSKSDIKNNKLSPIWSARNNINYDDNLYNLSDSISSKKLASDYYSLKNENALRSQNNKFNCYFETACIKQPLRSNNNEMKSNFKSENLNSVDKDLFLEDLTFENFEASKHFLKQKQLTDRKRFKDSCVSSKTLKVKNHSTNFTLKGPHKFLKENSFCKTSASTLKNSNIYSNKKGVIYKDQNLYKENFFDLKKAETEKEISDVFTTFSQESMAGDLFNTIATAQVYKENTHESIVPSFFLNDGSMLDSMCEIDNLRSNQSYDLNFSSNLCTPQKCFSYEELRPLKLANTKLKIKNTMSQTKSLENISVSDAKNVFRDKNPLNCSYFLQCEKGDNLNRKISKEKKDRSQSCTKTGQILRIGKFSPNTPEIFTTKNTSLLSENKVEKKKERNTLSPRSVFSSCSHEKQPFLITKKANICVQDSIPCKGFIESKKSDEKNCHFTLGKRSSSNISNNSESETILCKHKLDDINKDVSFRKNQHVSNNESFLVTSQIVNNLQYSSPNQYSSKESTYTKQKKNRNHFSSSSTKRANLKNLFKYKNQEKIDSKKYENINLNNSFEKYSSGEFQCHYRHKINSFSNTQNLYLECKANKIQKTNESYNEKNFNCLVLKNKSNAIFSPNRNSSLLRMHQSNSFRTQHENDPCNDFISSIQQQKFRCEKKSKQNFADTKLKSDINIEKLIKPNTDIDAYLDKKTSSVLNNSLCSQNFLTSFNDPKFLNFLGNKIVKEVKQPLTFCEDNIVQYPSYPIQAVPKNTDRLIAGCERKVLSKWNRYTPDTSVQEYKIKRNEWLNEVVKRERETCNFRKNDLQASGK